MRHTIISDMSSPSLRIFLLGEPRLEYGGEPLSLPQRESLWHLLTRLVLQSGQPLSRKNLAFTLWSDETEAESLANMRRHLYLLRNLLPPPARDLLLISPQSVSWRASPLWWVDVNEFEQAGESLDALEHAAELYRGDLALGVEGDDFLVARRESLRNRYLDLLKKLAGGYFERGEFVRALEWTCRLVAKVPWDEEAVRLKMTLEAQTGNRTAALATYQHLARNLERELGVQPMPETMSLYSDILHNRLMRLSPPKKSPAPLFVSREQELERLSVLFRGLSNGRGGVVFVSGQAGVGKTALLQESLRRLVENSDGEAPRVFWGSCPPPLTASPAQPYAPWSQVLNAAAPLLARSEEISAEWLNRLLPLVPDLALLKPGLLAPAQPNAAELRAALRQAFHALALLRPLILVIEDAHWADEASLEVLRELAETCQALPLLILVTHRLDDLSLPLLQIKRALRQRRALVELPLQTFRAEEAQLLLKTLLREKTLPPSLYEELTRYANGLPLLLYEAAETIHQARAGRSALPTLRDSITLRLQKLSRAAREMLEAAALLGFSFSSRELEALLGWPSSDFTAALDNLSASRFLTEVSLPGAPDHAFLHQLIHEIIIETIPSARVVHLHQQAAFALQQVHAAESGFAGQIAAHYEAGGLPLSAARFWLEHARENTDLAAFEPALEAIERAESLVGSECSLEGRELQAQAALQRGVIAHYRGQASEALPLLEEALRLCRDFPALRAHALARLAYALYTCDRYAEAWQAADQSLQIARVRADSASILRALNVRGISALLLGRTVDAIQDLREALALEESASISSAQTVQSLNHLGTALVFAQDYAEAGEVLAKTVELARRGGLRRLEAAAITMQGQIALNCGRYAQAIELYRQSIEVAGESYLPGMWGKFAGRGAAYLRMGRLPEARTDFERGLEIARQVESRYGQLLMRVYLAFTALAGGRAPTDSLAGLEAEAALLNLPPVTLIVSLLRARLWRFLGDFDQSAAAHQIGMQAAQASNVPQFLQNAQLEWLFTQAHSGLCDQAALDLLSVQAQTSGEVPQQVLANLTLAAALRSESRPAEALTAAYEALALARSFPDQILAGEALTLLLHLHESLGQTQEAQSCRVQLHTLAETAFAPFHLALDTPCDPALRQLLIQAVT